MKILLGAMRRLADEFAPIVLEDDPRDRQHVICDH
jgi:hypothetical protein